MTQLADGSDVEALDTVRALTERWDMLGTTLAALLGAACTGTISAKGKGAPTPTGGGGTTGSGPGVGTAGTVGMVSASTRRTTWRSFEPLLSVTIWLVGVAAPVLLMVPE